MTQEFHSTFEQVTRTQNIATWTVVFTALFQVVQDGNKSNVHQQMNGKRKHIYIYKEYYLAIKMS